MSMKVTYQTEAEMRGYLGNLQCVPQARISKLIYVRRNVL